MRRYRFRFTNPLLQPFVAMQGIKIGRVPAIYLNQKGSSLPWPLRLTEP